MRQAAAAPRLDVEDDTNAGHEIGIVGKRPCSQQTGLLAVIEQNPHGPVRGRPGHDGAGRLQLALSANAFGGDHELVIEAQSSGLEQRIALTNLGPTLPAQRFPVPGPGPLALFLFTMLALLMVRGRL